jgi:hypothetical protein
MTNTPIWEIKVILNYCNVFLKHSHARNFEHLFGINTVTVP